VVDKVLDTAHLAHEAGVLKARAADAFSDGAYAVKRAVRKTMRDLEDVKEDAVVRVRKAPLATVGVTFIAGLLLGAALGWLGHRPRRDERRSA
jgi:ElaB/YqjD/DUF883 family membrane-anchored ribosome-binding protein